MKSFIATLCGLIALGASTSFILRPGDQITIFAATPSSTPSPTRTSTPTPTATPSPSPTPTATASPTPTPGGAITATNCPQPAVCSSVACPTSTNWINPLNQGAVGDGVHDDTAALRAANNAGDVCFPSGKTFLVNTSGGNGAISTSVSNKHWQAGMIGGAAPVIKQVITAGCSGSVGNCFVYTVLGPSSGQITGDSVIGLDFEGPNTAHPPTYNEWDMAIRVVQYANGGLYAGNIFNNFEGDGEIELVGDVSAVSATPCINHNRIAYNTFKNSGLYGAVLIAGQNNTFDHNVSTDASEGQENDTTGQCSGVGNVFDHETLTMISGEGWSMAGSDGCGVFLTGGAAAGANYSGNTVSNSTVMGSASKPSCLGGQGTYTNNSCTNGCVLNNLP